MSDANESPIEGPDFEVWNHLESGWQMAFDDLRFKLPPSMLEFYQNLACIVVGAKAQLRVDVNNPDFRAKVDALSPSVAQDNFAALVTGLLRWYATGRDQWLSHAVHLEIASQGIGRATSALERFDLVAAQSGGAQATPEKSLPYLREVVDCFLFGFDAATIALARSTLEQVARTVLVRVGAYTEAQLRREKPDLESLLARLRQSGAMSTSTDAATRLRERGNIVLHRKRSILRWCAARG